MKRLASLLILLLSACTSRPPPTAAPSPTPELTATPIRLAEGEPMLVFFTSEYGRFQAWLPVSGSMGERVTSLTVSGFELPCNELGSRLNGAIAVVRYCELPVDALTGDPAEILASAESSLAADFRLRVDGSEFRVDAEGRPEHSFWGQADLRGAGYNGEFEARLVLTEARLSTILMAVEDANDCLCRHLIGQVVDSLYIESPDPQP